MNHGEKSQICDEAELHYLSLVFGDEYGDVPERIAGHVESCGYCRMQLKALREHLLNADTGDSENSRLSEAQTYILGLHLAYLGKEVGCEIVKPFLPTLLIPSLEARVPTPITVHLDRCESCGNDLATIRRMNLTTKQLRVLNTILSDNSSAQSLDCSVAADSIRQYVDFNFQAIEPKVVKHLCNCNICQTLIYKDRAESIRSLQQKDVQTSFPCDSVTYSDVFDYCFPHGLVPYSDQYAGFRLPFVNELRQCAKCLKKVQDLHQQVYAIRQRAESGVLTVYEIGAATKLQAGFETEDNYAGFPANVRTISSIDHKRSRNIRQKHIIRPGDKTRILKIGFKNLVKVAVAAVVILSVTLVLQRIPTATAMTVQQVYDAIQKAVTVHTLRFYAESTEPLQEKWVSKDLGIYAIKDKYGFVIWDVSSNVQYRKTVDSSEPERATLSEVQSAAILKRIQGSLGLMPFEDISELPENAQWRKLDIPLLEGASADTEIYELLWTVAATDGSLYHFKWRGFIEEATNAPFRVEFYSCESDSGEYKLETIHLIEYWTENQMKDFLTQILP